MPTRSAAVASSSPSKARSRALVRRREEILEQAASAVPVQTDRNGTRDRVLEAATQLFARKGFEACTMRDLASAANVKAPALYNHFGSKEQILGEAMRTALSGFLAYVLEPLDPEAPEGWLALVVRRHVLFQIERTGVAAANDLLITREGRDHRLPEDDEKVVRQLQRAYFEFLRDLLRGALAGRAAARDAVLVFAVIAMCDRTSAWFTPDGALTAEQVADETWALVERLIDDH